MTVPGHAGAPVAAGMSIENRSLGAHFSLQHTHRLARSSSLCGTSCSSHPKILGSPGLYHRIRLAGSWIAGRKPEHISSAALHAWIAEFVCAAIDSGMRWLPRGQYSATRQIAYSPGKWSRSTGNHSSLLPTRCRRSSGSLISSALPISRRVSSCSIQGAEWRTQLPNSWRRAPGNKSQKVSTLRPCVVLKVKEGLFSISQGLTKNQGEVQWLSTT